MTSKTYGDFVSGVESSLETLSPKLDQVRSLISTRGSCEFFVGVLCQASTGFLFTPDLMMKLAREGIDLAVSVYSD